VSLLQNNNYSILIFFIDFFCIYCFLDC